MTDRPIIFSGPMVRALLDGRKTQTRRVLKPWPGMQAGWLKPEVLHAAPTYYLATVEGHLGVQMQHPQAGKHYKGIDIDPMSPLTWVRLPYAPGDRLYVRENFIGPYAYEVNGYPPRDWGNKPIWFPADGPVPEKHAGQFWHCARPCIQMPRWASRLTLTVTDVRVERLQDISEADAVAEGCECDSDGWRDYQMPETQCCGTAIESFRSLWNSLHGPDAWDANPWVVALTFTVRHGNIDT